MTNFWHNNWQSIIDFVERLFTCFNVFVKLWLENVQSILAIPNGRSRYPQYSGVPQHDTILDNLCAFSDDFDNLSLLNKNLALLNKKLVILKNNLAFSKKMKKKKKTKLCILNIKYRGIFHIEIKILRFVQQTFIDNNFLDLLFTCFDVFAKLRLENVQFILAIPDGWCWSTE